MSIGDEEMRGLARRRRGLYRKEQPQSSEALALLRPA
jgi:hypothetical protein